jgi:hypothetical protein
MRKKPSASKATKSHTTQYLGDVQLAHSTCCSWLIYYNRATSYRTNLFFGTIDCVKTQTDVETCPTQLPRNPRRSRGSSSRARKQRMDSARAGQECGRFFRDRSEFEVRGARRVLPRTLHKLGEALGIDGGELYVLYVRSVIEGEE